MPQTKKIIFAGGGTGGHIFPALNMARALKEILDVEILFFGTKRGLESRIIPKAGFTIKFIPVAGFQRRLTLKNLSFPWKLYKSMQFTRKILNEFKPDLVVGTGGYVMGPVLKTAQKMRIPTILQEQNSYPGVTTRLLAKKAKMVFLAYAEAKKFLHTNGKVLVTGNPIQVEEVTEGSETLLQEFGLLPEKKVILVVGGSQGAASINKAIKNILSDTGLPEGYQMLWQTGQGAHQEVMSFVKNKNVTNVAVVPFINGMHRAYKLTDFVICRAGAMTLSELMAAGLAAILVPYPHAAADHQYKNADALREKGAAMVIRDESGMQEKLAKALSMLVMDTQKKETMSTNMAELHIKDTFEQIIKGIREVLGEE